MKNDIGLLILRAGTGLMMLFAHGLPKLMNFTQYSQQFPDPLGLGSTATLGLAIFAEVFCAVALIVGVVTRLAAVPLALTMLVAALIIHASDPWNKKELALLYAVSFIAVFFTGPGKFSVDNFFLKKEV